MPLSGEAIRTMNYAWTTCPTTLRRIMTVLPSLTPEERKRVSEYIKTSEPSYEQVSRRHRIHQIGCRSFAPLRFACGCFAGPQCGSTRWLARCAR